MVTLAVSLSGLRHFLRDARGTIAVKFALCLPVLAVISLGAIDLNAVHTERSRLQAIADSAALAGGRELALAVDELGPIQRAEAFVHSHLSEWETAPNVKPDIQVIVMTGDHRALRVRLAGKRPSFFGDLLPPGGWNLDVDAVASPVSIAPLCVLTHGVDEKASLLLSDRAKIEAPVCLLHSNQTVVAGGFSSIRAATTQAVASARGNIQRAPQQGAPPIEDPYLDVDPRTSQTCPTVAGKPKKRPIEIKKSQTLTAGLHCDDYLVKGDAILTLAAGEHHFVGSRLILKDRARLTGDDVVLVFDDAAFDFLDQSRVTLSGRRAGPLAGFVIIGLRPQTVRCPKPPRGDDDDDDEDEDDEDDDDDEGGDVGAEIDDVRPDDCSLGSEFLMASDNVEGLEGVIYFPVSRLIVQGTDRIAEASDWTVMVVQSLEIRGSPTLVINADYSGAVVPVPAGVGPGSGVANLVE